MAPLPELFPGIVVFRHYLRKLMRSIGSSTIRVGFASIPVSSEAPMNGSSTIISAQQSTGHTYCGKCGALNPNENVFCAACGSSIKRAVQAVVSDPVGAVSPIPEPARVTPAPAVVSTTVDPLKGMGGWLLLFCLGLVAVQPIALFLEAINSGDALVAGFNLLLGVLAICTGVALWRVASNALRLVKAYFVVVLIVGILAIVGGIVTASATPSQTPPQENFLTVGFRMLIGVAIWWYYFRKSKRVKATYGANL